MATRRKKTIDPHAQREANQYQNPIPSREFILDCLNSHKRAMSHGALCKALDVSDEEQQTALMHRLKAMLRDNQLCTNKRGAFMPIQDQDLITGIVIAHKDGFGFISPSDNSDDLYLHNSQMRQVFDGDQVQVQVSGTDARGRREANIVKVSQRNTQQIVGRYYRKSGFGIVMPDHPRINNEILIALNANLDANDGQFVVVKIIEQPSKRQRPSGEVIEVLGDHMAPGMEIDVAIRAHELPHTWPDAVDIELRDVLPEPSAQEKLGRIDIRDLPLVTIDGEDAKDFDDAVYCETKKSGGWRLWVAIADVSHYVKQDSALDQEAFKRSTSVYFPERVVPMLPEALSNGLCSLKPKVDRLCMVCEMTISATGKVSGYTFYEAVMHSHARLTYTEVAAMLDHQHEDNSRLREQFSELTPHLEELYRLYQTLREVRSERGAIDFETVETQIIFGKDRKIDAIVPRERNEAHKLIEECMLCANVAAAQFIEKHKLPALFRVHNGPSAEKLKRLKEYLAELGIPLEGGDDPEPKDYQALLQKIVGRDDFGVLQTILLRSMTQAVYQGENQGHFGLAFKAYAHFTSPIRRYPDLITHRAIKSVIFSDTVSNSVRRDPKQQIQYYKAYDTQTITTFGEQCSMAERRADDATRDVISWLKCEYLQDHVGDLFEGVITAVTGFGLFVELKDLYIEGLVHISSLSGDYYQYDATRQSLSGERSGTHYRLGDTIAIQVAAVNLDDRKIDLIIEGSTSNKPKKSRKSKSSKGRHKSANKKTASGGANKNSPAKASKSAAKKTGRKRKAR